MYGAFRRATEPFASPVRCLTTITTTSIGHNIETVNTRYETCPFLVVCHRNVQILESCNTTTFQSDRLAIFDAMALRTATHTTRVADRGACGTSGPADRSSPRKGCSEKKESSQHTITSSTSQTKSPSKNQHIQH